MLRCSVAVYTYLNDLECMKLKWEQVGDIFFSSAPTGKKKKVVVVLWHRNLFQVVSLMVKIQLEGKCVSEAKQRIITYRNVSPKQNSDLLTSTTVCASATENFFPDEILVMWKGWFEVCGAWRQQSTGWNVQDLLKLTILAYTQMTSFTCSGVCNLQSPKQMDCFKVFMKQVQKLEDQSSSIVKDTEESL